MDARDEALRTSFEEVMSIKITTKTLSSCEQYHPCDSYHATNAVGVNGSREAAFPLPGGEREASEAKQGSMKAVVKSEAPPRRLFLFLGSQQTSR